MLRILPLSRISPNLSKSLASYNNQSTIIFIRTMSTTKSTSSSSSSAPSTPPSEPEIIFHRDGSIMKINLNRPRALNSLSLNMIRLFEQTIPTWYHPKHSLSCIIMQGNGGKAFCAGGDIKQIMNGKNEINPQTGRNNQDAFFREEYIVDYRLAELTKSIPIIALWDGTVMGGGLGISINSSFRIATEKTVFAMPETAIGLIPDVGGSYFLPRVRPNINFGRYLALTGVRVTGADTVHTGLATHYIPSKDLSLVMEQIQQKLKLETSANNAHAIISQLLQPYTTNLPANSYSSDDLEKINTCFSKSTVEDIITTVQEIFPLPSTSSSSSVPPKKSVINDAVHSLSRLCPTSLKLTYQQLNYGSKLSLADCYKMELRLVKRLVNDGTDFYEGVRALLIDKDNKPKWNPNQLNNITNEYIQSFFQPLPNKQDELEFPTLP